MPIPSKHVATMILRFIRFSFFALEVVCAWSTYTLDALRSSVRASNKAIVSQHQVLIPNRKPLNVFHSFPSSLEYSQTMGACAIQFNVRFIALQRL